MTPIKAVKESAECIIRHARPVCPKWLIVLIIICAFIPLDPWDEIIPAIPLVIILIRNPDVWRNIKASLSMLWYEGVEI